MRQRMSQPQEHVDEDDGPAGQGETRTQQGETQQGVPRMPHERDESADSQAKAEPSNERMARSARQDAERGVDDTSKGAELDATYDKLRDEPKKFRP